MAFCTNFAFNFYAICYLPKVRCWRWIYIAASAGWTKIRHSYLCLIYKLRKMYYLPYKIKRSGQTDFLPHLLVMSFFKFSARFYCLLAFKSVLLADFNKFFICHFYYFFSLTSIYIITYFLLFVNSFLKFFYFFSWDWLTINQSHCCPF